MAATTSTSRPATVTATDAGPNMDPDAVASISPAAVVQDKSICFELVDLYFKYIHDQLHSLFHRPSFVQDLQDDAAPLVLVYGMMAMSAR